MCSLKIFGSQYYSYNDRHPILGYLGWAPLLAKEDDVNVQVSKHQEMEFGSLSSNEVEDCMKDISTKEYAHNRKR